MRCLIVILLYCFYKNSYHGRLGEETVIYKNSTRISLASCSRSNRAKEAIATGTDTKKNTLN